MGSAFLCAAAGIGPPTIEQSAAYIDGWRRKLKEDKRLVIRAAGQGQRAADHILGVTFDAARRPDGPDQLEPFQAAPEQGPPQAGGSPEAAW